MTFEGARPAEATDLARLAELATEATDELIPQRGGTLWSVREARNGAGSGLADLVASPDALVLVGTFDDVTVGYAVVRVEALRDATTLGVLDDLFVEPAARGVGVGEAMMQAVLAWCEQRGCRGVDSLALPGNRETKNFFERFGLTTRALVVHRPLGRFATRPTTDATDT